METVFGYQIWKPVNNEAREAILKQMQVNHIFEKQPMADNYKMVSEEILNIRENYELSEHTAGFGLTIWDMAKNYRKFKGEENFELGDVIVIYHTYKEGKKTSPCFLTVGRHFYGWDKDANDLLRDYEPVQESWLAASRTSAY